MLRLGALVPVQVRVPGMVGGAGPVEVRVRGERFQSSWVEVGVRAGSGLGHGPGGSGSASGPALVRVRGANGPEGLRVRGCGSRSSEVWPVLLLSFFSEATESLGGVVFLLRKGAPLFLGSVGAEAGFGGERQRALRLFC